MPTLRYNKLLKIYIVLQVVRFVDSLPEPKDDVAHSKISIAIVGAGIGGSSTAFFLSELFTKDQINVDIYEANAVGGRAASDVIDGHRFDTGASVFNEEHKYAEQFRNLFGFEKRKSYLSGNVGYFNGKKYVPINSAPPKGDLDKYADSLVSKFNRIYDFQKEKKCFEDVHSMLQSLDADLPKYLTTSARQGFLDKGFSKDVVDTYVAAATLGFYGIPPDKAHEFVGAYALHTWATPRLYQIEGGNDLIPEGLVNASGANLIPQRVQEVKLNADGTFKVTTNKLSKIYNYVVIATPITKDYKIQINFKQFPEKIQVPGRYKRWVPTILKGKINSAYFGLSEKLDDIAAVLDTGGSPFYLMMRIAPVNSKKGPIKEHFYNVDADAPTSKEELDKLFLEKSDVHVYEWLSNPYYDTSGRNDKFVLHKNLFHISAIEWIASAMEMSSISGKNIALLIYNSVYPKKPI